MGLEVSPPPLPGDHVGPYVLGEVLGVGGNATVYRASSPDHPVTALKILHPGKIDTDERRRFRKEFLTLQRLRHPGVLQVHEFGIQGDYPWIAMEFVDGIDLDTQIERWRAEPSADRFQSVERIFRGLCEALAYVHERGLIHRDLKPSNVLLSSAGQPKLSDFGFVKTQGTIDTHLTQAGRLVGTVAFMAPEQIMGEPVDSRVDLYSLGAVLYVLLTLQKPIEADSIPGYLARHLTHVPRPPSELDPRVPLHLERICTRLLLKDPAQRFASARQVLEALDTGLPDSRLPIHGREGLIRALLVRLEALRRGAGGVVIVRGTAGSGKSCLLAELADRARSAGNDIARCSGADDDPLAILAAQLPALEAATPADRLAAAVRRRPLTLLVDDLDRLEDAALAQLVNTVRDLVAVEGERMLVIGSVTCEEGGDSRVGGRGLAGGFISGAATGLTPEQIALEGLDRRASIALVRDRGVSGAAGAALGNRLHEELGGHPGAILDQIEALVSAGWLVSTPEGLRSARSIDDLREAPLPVSQRVRAQHEAELARLSPAARTILDVLVVLEMEGTSALVARLTGLTSGEVDQAVDRLAEQRLALRRLEGASEVLALHPEQPRNLLYAIIPAAERAALHRRVADLLLQRSRRRLGPMAEVIAHHMLQGGQVAEAWPLLLVAAQRRLRAGKLKTARRLLRLAMDAQPAAEASLPPEESRRNRRLLYALDAESREKGGDLTGAVGAWERALVAAETEGDPETVARIRSGLGLARTARGDVELAAEGLESAIGALQRGDPMWPRVARALAQARLESGDVSGAEVLWGELLELSRATESPTRRAEALAGMGQIRLARGDIADGRAWLSEALPTLLGQHPDPEQARRLLMLAELELWSGSLHDARRHTAEAEQMGRDVQRLMTCVRALGLAACVVWALGDDAEASRHARSAMALLTASDVPSSAEELRARLPLVRAWALLGSPDRARGLLPPSVLDVAPGLDDPTAQHLALFARLCAAQEPARALEAARTVLERPLPRLPWVAARVALDAAHAMRTLERITAARMALGRADTVLRSGELGLLSLEAARLRAELSHGTDGREEAARLRAQIHQDLDEPSGFWSRWG